MNDMELLATLRAQIPLDDASPRAERLFLAGIAAETATAAGRRRQRSFRRRRPPAWQLALAAGLSGALAAAVAGVVTLTPGRSPARGITATELAYRAAAAALRQPQVRPGQWVYRQESLGGRDPAPAVFSVWTTADSTKSAWLDRGKLTRMDFGGRGTSQSIGQPMLVAPGNGDAVGFDAGTIPVRYAALGSLPRSPQALLDYLAGLPARGRAPAAAREFEIIQEMITSYVMPPRLTAELYRALGQIPGVAVDLHAVDVAGRHGIGFLHTAAGAGQASELILDSHTYQLMGSQYFSRPKPGHPTRASFGIAYLRTALVRGPGVMP